MNNHWSDNLRKRMEAHEEPAPDGLWKDIEQAMISKPALDVLQKRRSLFLWARRMGAVAAVVLFCLTGYFIFDKITVEIPKPSPEFVQKHQQLPSDTVVEEDQFHKETEALVESINKPYKNVERKESNEVTESLSGGDTGIKEDSPKVNESEKEVPIKKDSKKSGENHSKIFPDNKSDFALNTDKGANETAPSKWETSLYASNLSSGAANKYSGYGNLVSTEICPDNEEPPSVGQDVLGDIFINNKSQDVYTDVKHKQPVTFGVSVSYHLNQKWSLTSGVTYTMLSSDLRSGSSSYYYYSKQAFHYVGIPLNVNYNVWKNKKISVYTSGGGLVEKNVSGKLKTDYILDNRVESSKEKNISIDDLQWSLNGAVGIQYNLSQKIGIYTEPGISYYFKDKSEFETIYKEKPLNFRLQFGFRLSLGEL